MTQVLVPEALEANRAGRLTDAQRNMLRAGSRGMRKAELQFALIFTVIGLLVWFAQGPPKYANIKPLVGIGFLVIAGALLVRSFMGADARTRDLRSGRVESVEGAITKSSGSTHSGNSSSTWYFVQVGKVRAETGSTFYHAVPDGGIARMYYLPTSRHLVNLEQLADRPLPEGALTDPRIALRDAKQVVVGSLFGNPVHQADARAELAAIGHALNAQFAASTVPPPAGSRDPRPLAEAIAGDWHNAMMKASFAADGTVTATLPGGMQRAGRWSVDSTGRLVSDVMGAEAATDAWVVGDQLTIIVEGNGVVLQRVV